VPSFQRVPLLQYYKNVYSRGIFSGLSRFCLLCTAVLTLSSGCSRGAHPAQVGKSAPDFSVSDSKDSIHLASYRGKVVVLNFWASWCGPCIQETPGLESLHHEQPDLAILGVSVDEHEDAYRQFLVRHHIDMATVWDPNQTAAKLYHSEAWPETYIIDRQGVIRRKIVGDPDWTNPEIRSYLKNL
jgi:cytochrome c biogenesis protein CcmG, thiol:disulfide interchange protein DsbE